MQTFMRTKNEGHFLLAKMAFEHVIFFIANTQAVTKEVWQ